MVDFVTRASMYTAARTFYKTRYTSSQWINNYPAAKCINYRLKLWTRSCHGGNDYGYRPKPQRHFEGISNILSFSFSFLKNKQQIS